MEYLRAGYKGGGELTFSGLHQITADYLRFNVDVFSPKSFLDLMVVVGRSESDNRQVLQFSDFHKKEDLKLWVAEIFQEAEPR
jgi:hypothetical protein